MKKFPLFDLLFILVSACILIFLVSFGYAEVLGKFSLIVALVGYFVGKGVAGYELRKSAK